MGKWADYEVEQEIDNTNWSEKKPLNPANYKKYPLIGIRKWLDNQWLSGTGKSTQYESWENRIMSRYCREEVNGITGKPSQLAKIISDNYWPQFKKWVKQKYCIHN